MNEIYQPVKNYEMYIKKYSVEGKRERE